MNFPELSKMPGLCLSDEDKRRLERLAPLFDLEFACGSDGVVVLRTYAPGREAEEFTLSAERAHVRLLAELCSRAVPWVYFHRGESAQRSILSLSDARLTRIAELYARALRGHEKTDTP